MVSPFLPFHSKLEDVYNSTQTTYSTELDIVVEEILME